jgi:hypothetical protein
VPPREAGEPITDQFMARQLGLAASENKKHLRQRTATIRHEQTAKNATNLFRNSNNPNELGFKHLVDIEGVTGSTPGCTENLSSGVVVVKSAKDGV